MILWIALSYFVGAIPVALLYGKRDILTATQIWIDEGWKKGIIVAITDLLKGLFAVGIPTYLGFPIWIILLSGVAAVWGQIFNPFNKFRGGGGLMTTWGVLTIYNPILQQICAAIIIPFAIKRKTGYGVWLAWVSVATLSYFVDQRFLVLGTLHCALMFLGVLIRKITKTSI